MKKNPASQGNLRDTWNELAWLLFYSSCISYSLSWSLFLNSGSSSNYLWIILYYRKQVFINDDLLQSCFKFTGKSFSLEFISNELNLFRFIPKSVSELIATHPSQSKKFQISFFCKSVKNQECRRRRSIDGFRVLYWRWRHRTGRMYEYVSNGY